MTTSARGGEGETGRYASPSMVWRWSGASDDRRTATEQAGSPWSLSTVSSDLARDFDAESSDPRTRLLADAMKWRFRLTRSEVRVALLLASRWSNREMAAMLGVTAHTARRHTEKVLMKLGIHSRTRVRSVLAAIDVSGDLPSGLPSSNRLHAPQPEIR